MDNKESIESGKASAGFVSSPKSTASLDIRDVFLRATHGYKGPGTDVLESETDFIVSDYSARVVQDHRLSGNASQRIVKDQPVSRREKLLSSLRRSKSKRRASRILGA